MNFKKLVALMLALAMVLSLAACGGEDPVDTTPNTTAPATDPAPTDPAPTDPEDKPVVITDGDVSVTFDDGNFGFVNVYEGRANSDASTLEVVEINGNKALKVTNGSGKVPYVAIDVWSLLGENAANVATIEMTLGIENPDGTFYACSGSLLLWDGSKLGTTTHDWSVYLASKNPKLATFTLKDYEAFSAENSIAILTLATDNGATAGEASANLYIYNITFKDADKNILSADTSVSFVAPNGFAGEKDMSNLKYLGANAVSLDGMAGITGTAWGQNGIEMTDEFIAALVPGAIVEIEFTSTTGDMWIVMPWATVGWSRVEQQTAATNNSKNICQITYEQIAAVCGENVADWGAMFQCESSGDWAVYSVKVGQDSGLVQTAGKTLIDGFACTGTAWGQNGIELTADQWAMLQPGTIIEVQYSSTSGDLWLVLPWATAGWTRIEQQTAACNGSVMQITYEQIAAVLGDDVSAWGTMLQCESSGDWEVFSVSICTGSFGNVSGLTLIDGFACSGDGWAQNGFELTADQWALMVPGAVIEVKYNATSGNLWAVLPWSTAGWMRINADNGITPISDGSTLQVTYEQIASVCGEDVSAWGTMLQFESEEPWEVYTVSIGVAE